MGILGDIGGAIGGFVSDPLGSIDSALFGKGGDPKANYDPNAIQGVSRANELAAATEGAFNTALGQTRGAPIGQASQVNLGLGFNQGMGQANAIGMGQMNLGGQLFDAAAGTVPSAAEIQMQQGLEQGLRNQLAAANSARGGTGASLTALRQAQDQGAQMSAQTNQAMAAQRAQEQAVARGLLSEHLGGMRGQSLQGAGLGLQAGTTNAQLGQQMTLANMDNVLQARGMDDARMLGLGNLALGTAQTNINRDLGVQGMNLDLAMGQSQGSMQRRQGTLGALQGGMAMLGLGGGV